MIEEKHSLLILLIIILIIDSLIFSKLINQNQKQTYCPSKIDIEEMKVSYIANQIIMCESNNKMVWGDNNLPVKVYGVAQFQLGTFNWLKKLANRPELNYYNEEDQVWLLKWAIKNKKGSLWSCYNKLNLTRFE